MGSLLLLRTLLNNVRNRPAIMFARAISGMLLLLAALLITVPTIPKYYSSGSSFCIHCGIIRTVTVKTMRITPYLKEITYSRQASCRATVLSRALHIVKCAHQWRDYRFGLGSGHLWRSWIVQGSGDRRATPLRDMLSSEPFAQALLKTERPAETWAALVTAFDSNRELEASFRSLCNDDPAAFEFGAWWQTNRPNASSRKSE
jgi:hypothetical protein